MSVQHAQFLPRKYFCLQAEAGIGICCFSEVFFSGAVYS